MNKKYPNRPNSLTLEELSRRNFIDSLPEDWLAERPANDYGIDLRVDIFKDNQATGLEFLVQLKSAQKASQNESEKVTLKISTYNYLRRKTQVAILVKYIKVENESYWLLLKDIPTPNQENDTFTVHIPKSNKLSEINWDDIYSHIRKVTDEKLATIRIDKQTKRKRSLQIAQEITATNQYKAQKEYFISSSEGVSKAENEVEKLFKEFYNLVEEIESSSSEIFIKIKREDDSLRKILDITSKNMILSIVWHNNYKNSLKSSSLTFWLTKNFRWFDDYGEKGEVISKEIYYSNINTENKIGWSKSIESSKIVISDELTDCWLSKFLKLID